MDAHKDGQLRSPGMQTVEDQLLQPSHSIFLRILGDLLSATPDDLPRIETCNVCKQLGLLSTAAFYDAYTAQKLLGFGGKANEEGYFVRVNRADFRGWLSEHINISWNKRFSHYEETDSGVTAYFRDGTSTAGSILVGADGINSLGMTK